MKKQNLEMLYSLIEELISPDKVAFTRAQKVFYEYQKSVRNLIMCYVSDNNDSIAELYKSFENVSAIFLECISEIEEEFCLDEK